MFDTLQEKLQHLFDPESYIDERGEHFEYYSGTGLRFIFYLYGDDSRVVATKVRLALDENVLDSYRVSLRLGRSNWITLSPTGIKKFAVTHRPYTKKKELNQTELQDF